MTAGFDVDRVLEWSNDPKRKQANAAFTAGGERQAAYLIEFAETRVRQAAADARERIVAMIRVLENGWQ